MGPVIRDVVIHINGEQPLVADLFEVPAAADIGLRCTNLRTIAGKRPVFADDQNSVFFFPYVHIRFVEILPRSLGDTDLPVAVPVATSAMDGLEAATAEPEEDLEIDEDFLRRIREV
jgi:hypothetical protein